MGISAVVGGSIVGGLISSDGAQSAADTQAAASRDASAAQTKATEESIQAQKDMQQKALDFQLQQTQPYTDAGKTALAQYMAQLNGGAAGFDVSKIPGYDFMKKEAVDAMNNSAAAGVGALSGNAQKALVDRVTGLASTQYGSYLDRIGGLVNLGEGAAVGVGNSGAGIIQSTGNNISSAQLALGNNLASNTIGAGNAIAAGQVGSANALSGGLNNISNSYLQQKSLQTIFGGGSGSSGDGTGIAANANLWSD